MLENTIFIEKKALHKNELRNPEKQNEQKVSVLQMR